MTGTGLILPAALALLFAGAAAADPLTEAAEGLCLNVKTCALEQVAEQDLTPEVREMMGPMMDNMCASMRSQVKEVPQEHELYDLAVGCMRSLESLTCAQMQDPGRVSTPQCEAYEKQIEKSGITTR